MFRAICFSASLLFSTSAAAANPATEATRAANDAVAARLPIADRQDFEDARRGKIAEIEGGIIRDADGNPVWDAASFAFLDGDAAASVNPSLWRQSRLLSEHGLFKVTDGIWQVRGYDLANMTIIRGKTGWIVIDPLLSVETAAAALKLVNDHLGERPVSAIIFTHSHADHFAGVGGLGAASDIPVIAPAGFLEEAISENLLAGPYMRARAAHMFGNTLPRGPRGQVGVGLGQALSSGKTSLRAPTREVAAGAEPFAIDGVTFEFLDAAQTEAPAEFVFFIPEMQALIMSEVTSGTLHNALTLRGAKVRDLLAWSRVIDGALLNFGGRANTVLASHHWPTWGRDNVRTYLQNQRDIYRYIHDQTVRRANRGETLQEIGDALAEPDFAARDFSVRGYYGTMNHNAKAVYQHYFGWWDGVPANYNPHPPEAESKRYVAAMGGADRVLALGAAAHAEGDDRWAARLYNHLVFAGEGGEAAKQGLANSYEQLGYRAESGAWRDYYLSAARELREGPAEQIADVAQAAFLAAVPTDDLFDALAVRYAPEKAPRTEIALQFIFPDRRERLSVEMREAVLIPRLGVDAVTPAATLTMNRSDLDLIIARQATPTALIQQGKLTVEGQPDAILALFGSLDQGGGRIAIVTP
ncbi:MBL fold metallo-hydrolase [Pacificimonas sp. WHA3]|uniref:MBL fold metallo-hydrolase n=1 Tax=Pacificimonas pallii TaxID=2827236 RepID=A0ABS6SFN5_9SPHN|nr:alkyl sulfatase dimerization domain-containing protein [Pacificimonas pallii]MBV7257228.1 MBL fold metallo-hydrolase [Pacificimonas pallii]